MRPADRRTAAVRRGLRAVALLVLLPATARAQAWLPFRGEGNISLIGQSLRLSGHFDTDGSRLIGCAPSSAYLAIPEFEYGLTNKLAVSARVAYVASRFTGNDSDPCTAELRQLYEEVRKNCPECPTLTSLDTGAHYSTWQDAGVTLSYNVFDKGITVTPAVGITIPTHAYRTVGEAAPGQGRRALHLGVSAGRLLDSLPGAYVHARYTWSFVQPLYGITLNRGNAELEAGYALTPTVSLRALLAWQQTQGGITYAEAVTRGFGADGRPATPVLFLDHDRLLRNRYVHLGGGATIALTDTIDLNAAVLTFVSGSDSHYGVGMTFGLGWKFMAARVPSPSNPVR